MIVGGEVRDVMHAAELLTPVFDGREVALRRAIHLSAFETHHAGYVVVMENQRPPGTEEAQRLRDGAGLA